MNAYSQPKENFIAERSDAGITCHEVSVSIVSIVTVNNIYICCGGQFVNNSTIPPRLCGFVSKKSFDFYQTYADRLSSRESVNIRDLIPDEGIVRSLTEIVVEKSTVFQYDGKSCTIKPGKYAIDDKGEVFFEIVTLNQ